MTGQDARSRDSAGAGVDAGVAGTSTAIEITLATDYGTDLRALGDRARDTVITRVRELTDLEPVEVTIISEDVLPLHLPDTRASRVTAIR